MYRCAFIAAAVHEPVLQVLRRAYEHQDIALAAKLAVWSDLSADELRAARDAANPTGRIGRPEEFGAACAFLASVHAGYIVGQNILMDGGETRMNF